MVEDNLAEFFHNLAPGWLARFDDLSREQIGIDDSFFELGGHSLLATQVISRIREAFRVELPLRVIFESQSIASLSARILSATDSGDDFKSLPLSPISRDGELPLSFAQQTGSVSGTVTASDGSALPGVTVEARSDVLPQPRVTLTDGTGMYRLPALVPGTYRVQFSLRYLFN